MEGNDKTHSKSALTKNARYFDKESFVAVAGRIAGKHDHPGACGNSVLKAYFTSSLLAQAIFTGLSAKPFHSYLVPVLGVSVPGTQSSEYRYLVPKNHNMVLRNNVFLTDSLILLLSAG